MDTPIYLAPADRDFIPHTYVIHKHSQLCHGCGTLHEHSKVYAKTHMASRAGHKYFPNLRPVLAPNEITYNLPIEILIQPRENLLFCHDCVNSATLAHLPTPPKPKEVLACYNTQDTEPKPKTKITKYTIDDL